jgi:prevent-host-death family protein
MGDHEHGRPGQRTDHYNDHTVRHVTATHAKAHLLSLLDEVQGGESVEITRHGRVIARIVPARGAHALRGQHAGVVRSNADEEGLFSTGVEWELE